MDQLHSAVEAKEGVPVQGEAETFASVSASAPPLEWGKTGQTAAGLHFTLRVFVPGLAFWHFGPKSPPPHFSAVTRFQTTYQSFFRLFPKLSGMTGTASTEQVSFSNSQMRAFCVWPAPRRPSPRRLLLTLSLSHSLAWT